MLSNAISGINPKPHIVVRKGKRIVPKPSNEERLLLALNKRGSLRMKVQFLLMDEDGRYRSLRGVPIYLRGIPNQGKFWQVLDRMTQAAKEN